MGPAKREASHPCTGHASFQKSRSLWCPWPSLVSRMELRPVCQGAAGPVALALRSHFLTTECLDCSGYLMLLRGTLFHLGEKACFRSRMGGRAGEENLELFQTFPSQLWDRRLGFSASLCCLGTVAVPSRLLSAPGRLMGPGTPRGVPGLSLVCGSGKEDPQTCAHPVRLWPELTVRKPQESRGPAAEDQPGSVWPS